VSRLSTPVWRDRSAGQSRVRKPDERDDRREASGKWITRHASGSEKQDLRQRLNISPRAAGKWLLGNGERWRRRFVRALQLSRQLRRHHPRRSFPFAQGSRAGSRHLPLIVIVHPGVVLSGDGESREATRWAAG
jgi:hypothetical protein